MSYIFTSLVPKGVFTETSLFCAIDLSAFLVGCILWNILPDDGETIIRHDEDQAALEMGQIDKDNSQVPSMGYASGRKTMSEPEEEDAKAYASGAFTRVEPVV